MDPGQARVWADLQKGMRARAKADPTNQPGESSVDLLSAVQDVLGVMVATLVSASWMDLARYALMACFVVGAIVARLAVHKRLATSKARAKRNNPGDGRVRVWKLFVYPVRGCGAVSAKEAGVGDLGLAFDHHWAVVGRRAGGNKSADLVALSADAVPGLVRVKPQFRVDGPTPRAEPEASSPRDRRRQTRTARNSKPQRPVSTIASLALTSPDAPGEEPLLLPAAAAAQAPAGRRIAFRLDGRSAAGIDCGDEAAAWFGKLAGLDGWTGVRVVRLAQDHRQAAALAGDRDVPGAKGVAFAGAPIVFVSDETLYEIATSAGDGDETELGALAKQIRANVVVTGVPGPHFEELFYEFSIGNTTFHGGEAHPVTAEVDVDPETGGASDLSARIRDARSDKPAHFGKHIVPVTVGPKSLVAVGDELVGRNDGGARKNKDE
jgi:MOSC domain-containing protein